MSESRRLVMVLCRCAALGCVLSASLSGLAAAQAAQEHPLPVHPKTSPDVMTPAPERQTAPDFTLVDSDGKPLQLSSLRGKVVLLNFWATWCGGCKYEMPWFAGFDRTYRQKGLQVVGVSMDDRMDVAKQYLVQKHIPYTSVLGNDDLGKRFNLGEMPLTLLIDKQGRIAVRHSGVVDKNNVEEHLQQLLRS